MIPTIAGVILLIFFLFNWVGGDPAQVLAGKISNPEQIANIRKQLGVDQPYWYQLWVFVQQVFTFDFGRSWSTNEEVSRILLTRVGPTLTIMIPVLLIETFLAVLFAIMVAYVRGSLTDRGIMITCTVAMSISFLVYIIVFQWLFGFILGWFPVQGWSESFWKNLTTYAPLPIMLAVFVGLAPQLRLYRSFFLDEINQDYVRTARAKGLSEKKVMLKHVLRNALIPILTNIGISLPGIFVGSFLLEVFFSIPGLGREIITRGQPQRLPRDQGGDGLPSGHHHDHQPAGGRDVQVRRPESELQMSAVLTNPPLPPVQESPGLWNLAWRRLRQDAVGMVSLVIVAIFIAMMTGSYFGLIAKDWNKEKGVSYANPSFLAGAENLEARSMASKDGGAKAPPVDLSDIDPLAPRYKEWEERAAKIAVTETKRSEVLPFGGDKWGRDVLQKAIKGSEVSIFVGLSAALLATIIGTMLGAAAGYWGGWVNDVLEWVYNVFTSIPYILLILAFAAVAAASGKFGKGIPADRADPVAHRLDRHLSPDARRVHQALQPRVREGGPGDRRLQLVAHVRAHPSEREPRLAGAALAARGRLHQGRGDPLLPRLRRPRRHGLVGHDARRGAERARDRQVVAALRRRRVDGDPRDRFLPPHRFAARRARSQAEMSAMTPPNLILQVQNLDVRFRVDRKSSRSAR
jgi:peptide/nickel transport system permease protein